MNTKRPVIHLDLKEVYGLPDDEIDYNRLKQEIKREQLAAIPTSTLEGANRVQKEGASEPAKKANRTPQIEKKPNSGILMTRVKRALLNVVKNIAFRLKLS